MIKTTVTEIEKGGTYQKITEVEYTTPNIPGINKEICDYYGRIPQCGRDILRDLFNFEDSDDIIDMIQLFNDTDHFSLNNRKIIKRHMMGEYYMSHKPKEESDPLKLLTLLSELVHVYEDHNDSGNYIVIADSSISPMTLRYYAEMIYDSIIDDGNPQYDIPIVIYEVTDNFNEVFPCDGSSFGNITEMHQCKNASIGKLNKLMHDIKVELDM